MVEACEHDGARHIEQFVADLRAADARLPLSCTVELTHRCNFACPHCYCRLPVDAALAQPELSLTEWDRIFGECADEGVLMMLFTGGEPLLRSDFRELWMAAKRRGVLIELFTNASLVTAELADFLADWTPRHVSVTLYGASEMTYRRVCGQAGMHHQVLQALDLLVERGVAVEVKSLISRLNVHEWEALRKQALRYSRVFRWTAELNGSYPGVGTRPLDYCLSPKEIVALELNDPVRMDEWRKRLADWHPASPSLDTPFRCGAGRIGFHLDPYGKMRACLLLWGCEYDVRSGLVHEGWREAIPELMAGLEYESGPCLSCALAEVCRTCPAVARLAGRTPGTPPTFLCELGHERARAFGLPTCEQ